MAPCVASVHFPRTMLARGELADQLSRIKSAAFAAHGECTKIGTGLFDTVVELHHGSNCRCSTERSDMILRCLIGAVVDADHRGEGTGMGDNVCKSFDLILGKLACSWAGGQQFGEMERLMFFFLWRSFINKFFI